jgi:4'-phosphopantetheinyl transferase
MKESEKLPIDIHQVHLWYAHPELVKDADMLNLFFNILSEEEQSQQCRFVFEKDRHRYLVAHAFVRMCLSRYADVEPGKWVFQKNNYGKPYTNYSVNGLPLKFNLSHTNGLIACVVTLQHEVGVDVECIVHDQSGIEIAERYFSREEYIDIVSLPPVSRHKRFYNYWTLKEAYIKAKGVGLSMPMDKFIFRFDSCAPVQISFCDDVCDHSGRWKFILYDVEQKYTCAVAIECGDVPINVITMESRY